MRGWSLRADQLAVEHSSHPLRVAGWLIALSVVCGSAGVGLGILINDDAATYFREGMPGTWLSAALLLACAATARAGFWREHPQRRWQTSFWGLSAAILTGLFVIELTQPTVFLGRWLDHATDFRPLGIVGLDALLLIILLVGSMSVLAVRGLFLLRQPRALMLFVATAVIAFGSQAVDSFGDGSEWVFVAEESLKGLAETVLIAAYLTALARVIRDAPPAPSPVVADEDRLRA